MCQVCPERRRSPKKARLCPKRRSGGNSNVIVLRRRRSSRSTSSDEGAAGGAVGKVIESKSTIFNEGDIVEGFTIGWQKYCKTSAHNIRKIDPNIAPIQTALGVLGMPGMTAYFGLFEVCKPIPGDVVVVDYTLGAFNGINIKCKN